MRAVGSGISWVRGRGSKRMRTSRDLLSPACVLRGRNHAHRKAQLATAWNAVEKGKRHPAYMERRWQNVQFSGLPNGRKLLTFTQWLSIGWNLRKVKYDYFINYSYHAVWRRVWLCRFSPWHWQGLFRPRNLQGWSQPLENKLASLRAQVHDENVAVVEFVPESCSNMERHFLIYW